MASACARCNSSSACLTSPAEAAPCCCKPAKRFQIALVGVPRIARFDQLGIKREKLFAGAPGVKVRLISLRRLHLGLRTRGLAAQVGIIELQQQLALANVISFFYEQPLYRGWDRRMRFEILDGLHFAIGGNQAADGSALHVSGANLRGGPGRVKIGMMASSASDPDREPGAAFTRGGPSIRIVGCCQLIIFQGAAGTTASINLPLVAAVTETALLPEPLLV